MSIVSRGADTILSSLLGETGLLARDIAVAVSEILRDILIRDSAAEELRTMPDNLSKARMHSDDRLAIENWERCLGGTVTKLDEDIDNQAEHIDSLLARRLEQPDSSVPDISPLRELPPGSLNNQINCIIRQNGGDNLTHPTFSPSVSCGPPILEPPISNPTPPLSFACARESRITKKNSVSSPGFQPARPYHIPIKRRGNLSKENTDIMLAWLMEHLEHPYPNELEKQMLKRKTGLTLYQISHWFINARRRKLRALRSKTQ